MDSIIPITISRDGTWYYGTSEMFRQEILALLAKHLEKDSQGNYFINYKDQIHPVAVEHTPYVAKGIKNINSKEILMQLTDSRVVGVSPQTLFFQNNVPYATFRWKHDTRLSRQALWDLSGYLQEKDGSFFLFLDGSTYPLETN